MKPSGAVSYVLPFVVCQRISIFSPPWFISLFLHFPGLLQPATVLSGLRLMGKDVWGDSNSTPGLTFIKKLSGKALFFSL